MDVRPFEKDLTSARRALLVFPVLAVLAWVGVLVSEGTDGESARTLLGGLVVFLGCGVAAAGVWTSLRYKAPSADRPASFARSFGLIGALALGGTAVAVLGLVIAGGTRWQQ